MAAVVLTDDAFTKAAVCLQCRLLRDLHTVEATLEFWQNRLHQGSHLRFMLFGQGPISFAYDVVSALERKHKQRMTSATDKIERRVRSAQLFSAYIWF